MDNAGAFSCRPRFRRVDARRTDQARRGGAAWTSSRAVAPRIAVHLVEGESEVFRERHRAKERARLKKHSEPRRAIVKVRLARADVDAPAWGR